MKLRELWERTNRLGEIKGEGNPDIVSLQRDSRRVQRDSLFFCRRGASFDSHKIVSELFDSGVAACVVHRPIDNNYLTWLVDPDDEGAIASTFFDHPTHHLTVLGVTGTDGKSTTAWLATQLLHSLGLSVACLGTLGVWSGNHWEPWNMTTPEAEVLQATLAQLRDQGFTHVVMEVSSHGLSAGRVNEIRFDAVALTNLGRDHLDDYPSLEAYHQAKEKLFLFQTDPKRQVRPSSSPGDAHYRTGETIRIARVGENIQLKWDDFDWEGLCPLEGSHNLQNLETALGLVSFLGNKKEVVRAIPQLKSLKGRWQWVEGSEHQVMVDYAHTPDALDMLLKNVRKITAGKLHVLFGCGGNRDPGKRKAMGQVADRWADCVWVADDNPRQEDAEKIRQMICQGIRETTYWNIGDRRQAIQEAIQALEEKDVLVISGKGHESVQIVGDQAHVFSDLEIASEIYQGCHCGS